MSLYKTSEPRLQGNPLIYLFGKMWHYSGTNKNKVAGFWSMFVLAELVDLSLPPFITALIMQTLLTKGVTTASLWTLYGILSLMMVRTLLFWLLHGIGRVMEENNAFVIRANYRRFLLQGVMSLSLDWQTEHHSGDTIDKVEKGTTALYIFSQNSFEIIYSLIKLIGSFIVISVFSWPAALVIIGVIMLSVWVTIRFDQVLIGRYEELNHKENKISESVFDAISNITTVIILRVEKMVFSAIMHKVEEPKDFQATTNLVNEWKWFLTNVCCTLMVMLVLALYFWQHLGSEPGVLVVPLSVLLMYLYNISDLFFRFTSLYGDTVIRRAKVKNAEELSRDFVPDSFSNHVLPRNWRSLQIAGLTFSYQGTNGDNPHIDNVSLRIERGEKIAFVGKRGSGKTTMLKLLRDLHHPDALELQVDGQLISEGFAGISQAIALVPQRADLFASTVLENITLGANHDLETVRRFTDMTGMTEVIESLPKGFDSLVKERGVNLSGGQQQALALARGLLACDGKDIVLLDEPTSSQNTGTEMEICRNIFGYFKEQTIISSVHRLHLLAFFDRIFFFHEGRILSQGSFRELMQNCPEFVEEWRQYQSEPDSGISIV